MGLVRAGSINYADDMPFTYSTTIRFVHQCFYEYFVALYIAETLRADHGVESKIDSARGRDDILNTLKRNDGRYVGVKRLLAGLCMLPEYISISDTVLTTITTCSFGPRIVTDLPCVGVTLCFSDVVNSSGAALIIVIVQIRR